jgi:SAM-dependent methyltransferase
MAGSLMLLALLLVNAPVRAEYGDAQYSPTIGQAGKDVMWVPTPDEMVTRMLTVAAVTPDDLVYDLGAGDGKIAIAAARQFGARAVGIEYNPQLAALAKRNAARAGVEDKVRIIAGDIFVEDFSAATVVTLYLLPELNMKLRPILLRMKPGTRVVSHSFDMDDWRPDATFQASGGHYGYYWVVPARVEGTWALQLDGATAPATLELRQWFQKVEGTLTLDGRRVRIEDGRLHGRDLHFNYRQADGAPVAVNARIDGNRMSGHTQLVAPTRNLTGLRR